MARYKKYSKKQKRFVPVSFEDQILPGTFEFALDYLIDNEIDLSVFDSRYQNDETGAPAYDPAILLKIILYAYCRGIISSRKIARCCEENIIFMALSADSRPHFTTIADFVSSNEPEILSIFRDTLLVCDEEKLIGRDMFSIDGVKMPSNASKEWSGKRADFEKKIKKLDKAIKSIVKKHREMDQTEREPEKVEQEKKRLDTLRKKYRKIKKWMAEHEEKKSLAGNIVQSNITDAESAKMKSSHGVIQGYDGVAVVDSKHQVIVHGEAFGEAQENHLLKPMIEGTRENFKALENKKADIFDKTRLTADAGFHCEANMKYIFEEKIDGYIADTEFRKRDPLFADADRYKERSRKERSKKSGKSKQFKVNDFIFDDEFRFCICPAGKRLYRNGRKCKIGGYLAIKFHGRKTDCRVCELRPECLKHPDRTEARQVAYFIGRVDTGSETYTQKMKRKIDSAEGRFIYNKRLGTSEPVFGNIRNTLGLNRFTLRGQPKVNGQWLLYCIVHNIGKIYRYGKTYSYG